MRRIDLEHIIRAAGSIADSAELVVIGSQAILASFPEAPSELIVSEEADIYPADEPEKADMIDGSIGEKSPFHETFGYYAHGVSPDTAVLPANWKTRLVQLQNENTRGYSGFCLSPADLAISKLAAGREKDFKFVTAMLRHHLILADAVETLLREASEAVATRVRTGLAKCVSQARD